MSELPNDDEIDLWIIFLVYWLTAFNTFRWHLDNVDIWLSKQIIYTYYFANNNKCSWLIAAHDLISVRQFLLSKMETFLFLVELKIVWFLSHVTDFVEQ